MKRPSVVFCALFAVFVTACQGDGAEMLSESEQTKVVEGVEAMLADYVAAVNSGDLGRIMEFYANEPGFLWVENGAVAYDSYAAVQSAFAALQSSVREIRLSLGEPRIVPLEEGVAFVTVSYEQVFVDTSAARFETDGMITLVAVERPDGWKFLGGHASQPRPRP